MIIKELESYSNPEKQALFPKFFKTGKGEYGEGDLFLGITVPDIRKVAAKYKNISFTEITELLHNPYHECRTCALVILTERFKKSKTEEEKKEIYELYLSHTKYINNWDLVDISAKDIVGGYLINKDRNILYSLAESSLLWEQRISVIATFYFIKNNDFTDIISLSEKFLTHPHDLIHKATGWMLREVGKRDISVLYRFLDKFHKQMPRTMLRYSIEKLPVEKRKMYMQK